MKKIAILLSVILVLGIVVSGCTLPSEDNSSQPTSSGTNSTPVNNDNNYQIIAIDYDFTSDIVYHSVQSLPYYLSKTKTGLDLIKITNEGPKKLTSIVIEEEQNIWKYEVFGDKIVYELGDKIYCKNIISGDEKLLYDSRAIYIKLNPYDNCIYVELINSETENYEMACYDPAKDEFKLLSYTIQNDRYGYHAVAPVWINGEMYRLGGSNIEEPAIAFDGDIEAHVTDGKYIYVATYTGWKRVDLDTCEKIVLISYDPDKIYAFTDSAIMCVENDKLVMLKNGKETVLAEGLPEDIKYWYITDGKLICITN